MTKIVDLPFTKKDLELELARKDFYTFVQNVSDVDEWQHNWHLEFVAGKLEQVVKGEIKRLILSIPFRHGKSELASRCLPAYYLGVNPNGTVIGTSHSSTLAVAMSRDAKSIVQSSKYKEIFPNTKLNEVGGKASKKVNKSDHWEIMGHRGAYLAKGVGQGIQGEGGSLIIVDDVYANREDAYSETVRRKVENWFEQDLKSRLDNDGAIVVINTRMNHDDLIAYLQKNYPDEWEVINFPAIKENDSNPDDPREIGEALWPWRVSAEELNKLKETRPDIYWGPYQGKPSPPGGTILKQEGLQYYNVSELDLADVNTQIIQSWDLRNNGKGKKSSYAVGQLWIKAGPNAYLVDQVRGRWDSSETLKIMLDKSEDPRWKHASAVLVEAKADGKALIPMLKQHIPGIDPVEPKGSKEVRVEAIQPYWKGMNVFISKDLKDIKEFESEVLRFPAGTNDDQVDAMSQALNYLFNADAPKDVLVLF